MNYNKTDVEGPEERRDWGKQGQDWGKQGQEWVPESSKYVSQAKGTSACLMV